MLTNRACFDYQTLNSTVEHNEDLLEKLMVNTESISLQSETNSLTSSDSLKKTLKSNSNRTLNKLIDKSKLSVKPRQLRRIEANARERTRVHTISSAFEALRQTVPTYYNSYKLSKLGILRIACRYIESLNQLINEDLNLINSEKTMITKVSSDFDNYVRELAKTIAQESKMKNLLNDE